MKRLTFAAVLAAALTACATTPPAAAGSTAGLGGAVMVGGLRIRPLRVVEDSRCPINARCVWPGQLIVVIDVSSGLGRATHSLTLGEPIEHAGGRLTLIAAEPARIAGSDTEPSAYRFTFAVESP